MKIDYSEYDAKLLSLIKNGYNTFDILCKQLHAENKHISSKTGCGPSRVTDRRLQALRRKSLIKYCRHAQIWEVS